MRKQRINAGQMKEKIERYVFENGIAAESRVFWARMERKPQRCVFSRLGRGSDATAEITFYTREGLKADEIIKIRGQWHIPSFVSECDNSIYSYALCGQCKIVRCRATSLLVEYEEEYNRPENERGDVRFFDAAICERFISAEENGHFNGETAENVLVYPKDVKLGLADVIEIDNVMYNINRLSDGDVWREAVIERKDDI